MNEQSRLKKNTNGSKVFKAKIFEVENKISEKIGTQNANIVRDYINSMSIEGKFSQIGMWKLKNRLIPKDVDPPMGKYDEFGNVITAPEALKALYLSHYVKRLEHRVIAEKYAENYEKKMFLWQLRLRSLRDEKSDDWTSKNLSDALKSLKNNKTRDPSGYINELFKPAIIGEDLQMALLDLVNGIKREMYLPDVLQLANITTIYKKKGSRLDLENDRGIFTLSIFRKIIDRLIYQQLYSYIDCGMSDCNIGARKNKNIKNHLFIVYAVINYVLKSNSTCVDIHIYDLVKAFDVLWLEDSFNDLWDTIPEKVRNDKLSLLYQTCVKNLVAVNTSVGQTERVNIPRIITQGGTWGPILCSNSIDKIGKYAIEKGHSFKYKNLVDVIPLGMVDDILSISKCGFSSVEMNISINTQIELKKMKFHVPTAGKKGKCHSLHVGKESYLCPGMKVHGQQAERVLETEYSTRN